MDISFGLRDLRKAIAGLSIVAILLGFLAASTANAAFKDVSSGDWFYTYVNQLVDNGIVSSADYYRPGDNLNRAEMAKLAVLAAGLTESDLVSPATPSFSDVSSTAWFYKYVETAKQHGFVGGDPSGKYRPTDPVNRAEAAKILVNALELQENTAGGPHFSDVKETDWFYNVVETAYNWSVVDGYTGGLFKPGANVNRAEIAKMIVLAQNPVARGGQQGGQQGGGQQPTGGQLAVSLSGSSPAPTNLPSGSAYNTVAAFDFTAPAGTDVVLKGLTVTKGGYVANTGITGVSVWDSAGKRHGNIVQSLTADSKAVLSFASDPITVKGGTTETVFVKINICGNNACGGNITSGTVNFGIVSADDVVSTATSVAGTFPINGSTMGIVDGSSSLAAYTVTSLSVGGGNSGSEVELEVGQQQVELAKFKFQQSNSREDLKLTSMTLFVDGTVSSGDLINWKLYNQDGNVLSETAGMDSSKNVVFTLTTPYIIPKGSSRWVSVKADVADVSNNANRTIFVNLRNSYDVSLQGATTGAFIESTSSFPIPSSSDGYYFKIKEGSLTVSKSASSPTGYVPMGSDDVVLASYDLKAAGEAIEIQKIKLGFYSSTSGAQQITNSDYYLRGTLKVALDGNVLYSGDASSSGLYADTNSLGWTQLSSYGTVQAGQTGKLTVTASLQTSGISGQTYVAYLGSVYYRRVSSNNYATLSATQYGNVLTVESATLSVTGNGSFNPMYLVKGVTQAKIGSFKLQASSAEDLNVSAIKVQLSSVDGVSNLTLKMGDTQLGSSVSTLSISGNTISITGLTISKSTTVVIDVYADVTTSYQSDTLQVTIPRGTITATGKTSNETLENIPSLDVDSATINIATNGVLTLTADAANTPSQQILHANEFNKSVFQFKVSADNKEDIILNKLYFAVKNGEGNLSTVELYDGTTQLGSSSAVNNGQATFTGLNLQVAKGQIKYLTVKVSTTNSGVLGYSGGSSFTANQQVILAPDYYEYTGAASGQKVVQSGGVFTSIAASDVITVYDGSQFENGDAVRIDINGDGALSGTQNGVNEATTWYVCNKSGNTLKLNTVSTCDGTTANFTADQSDGGFILPTANPFFSNTMYMNDVEPTIALHPNSPKGLQGGQAGQNIAAFTITADGARPLTIKDLSITLSGAYVYADTYANTYAPMNFQLWRGTSAGDAQTQLTLNDGSNNDLPTLTSGAAITNNNNTQITSGSVPTTAKVQSGSVLKFTLASPETIPAGTTVTYVIKADTSSIKNPGSQGTSTLNVRIDGTKGGTGGLTWSYTTINNDSSGDLTNSDSYPVYANPLSY